MWEGEFQSYALCDRCVLLVNEFEESGEMMGEFWDTVTGAGFFECPECGSQMMEDSESEDNAEIIFHCACRRCGTKYTTDLSYDAVKEKIEQLAEETQEKAIARPICMVKKVLEFPEPRLSKLQ
jgi:hypothetical protein